MNRLCQTCAHWNPDHRDAFHGYGHCEMAAEYVGAPVHVMAVPGREPLLTRADHGCNAHQEIA